MNDELALTFACDGDTLVAVAHVPEQAGSTGVLVVVGGPQYRVGSHRQFVLLSRHLARHGIPVLRFDHRGIGDSSGASRSFLCIDDDIKCAIDKFMSMNPKLRDVCIWGICDAASAAMLYACQDSRVSGLVMLNPWVRTEAGLAKAYLTTYYLKLAFSAQFWKELLTGRRNIYKNLMSLIANVRAAMTLRAKPEIEAETSAESNSDSDAGAGMPFPDRMLAGLRKFSGRTLFVLSGEDITAAEFRNLVRADRKWKKTVRRASVSWVELPESNHTFSSREWRDRVASITTNWILEK